MSFLVEKNADKRFAYFFALGNILDMKFGLQLAL